MLKKFLYLAALVSLAYAAPAGAAEEMLPDALLYPGDRPGHILVADKANQMLYLYRHDAAGTIALDRIMACSTGEKTGDKLVEGDRKTPNGFYIFNQKLLPRELSAIYGALAYPTDYPNFWDRLQGRSGYGIWLHGIDKPLRDYDSNGCIELENADMARLEDLLELFDTPLITYETLTMAPVEELRREGQAVRDFLEDWRRAWSGKDHAAYRAKYAPEFVNSDNRAFGAWMTHKENVAGNYRDIKVELKNLSIYRHREIITASFVQDYQGDQRFHSVGLKRLYIRPAAGGYQIVGEEFRPLPSFDRQKKLTPEEKRLALTTPPKSAPPEQAEPEGRRAVVEARAAAEARARSRASGAARSEEGIPEVRGSLVQPPEQASSEAAASAAPPAREPAEVKPAVAKPEKATEPAVAKPAEPAVVKPEKTAEPAEVKPEKPEKPAEPAPVFAELVGQWAKTWALKDQEAYFAFYHPDFHYRAKNMDLAAFKDYRSALMKEAEGLEIQVSDFEIRPSGDRVRVVFRQDYRSDQLKDRGRKTLVFKKAGEDWKILSETWRTD
jgi:murein L,D-transpeptidase YafK